LLEALLLLLYRKSPKRIGYNVGCDMVDDRCEKMAGIQRRLKGVDLWLLVVRNLEEQL